MKYSLLINLCYFFTVFEIVVRIIEGMPWQDVLMKVLPMRKGVQACDNVSNPNYFDESDDSDDQLIESTLQL